jgi:hypothetical protein
MNTASSTFLLQAGNPNDGYSSYLNTAGTASEAFPQLPTTSADIIPQMSAPTIEIDFAPTTATRNMFDGKAVIDTDALIPPEQRGEQM